MTPLTYARTRASPDGPRTRARTRGVGVEPRILPVTRLCTVHRMSAAQPTELG